MFSRKKLQAQSKLGAWLFAGVLIAEVMLAFALVMLRA